MHVQNISSSGEGSRAYTGSANLENPSLHTPPYHASAPHPSAWESSPVPMWRETHASSLGSYADGLSTDVRENV